LYFVQFGCLTVHAYRDKKVVGVTLPRFSCAELDPTTPTRQLTQIISGNTIIIKMEM
jgi:hypothetical protein